VNQFLPTDEQVAQRLADTRIAVMEATRHVHSPKHSTRYRVTRNAIIAGVAIAALTAGAIAIVRAAQETIDSMVVCYQGASLDSAQVSAQSNPDEFDPISMCEAVWAGDIFEDGLSEDFTHPVPELILCALPDERVGAFPLGDARPEDFCAALGLADWDSD
jgi:hypothetical protein